MYQQDADFLIFAGHAAMIRAPAGLAHGAGAALANWKKADDMENLQKVGRNLLRAELEELFPERVLAPMKVNRSLRTITSKHMTMNLQARLGTLSRQDLDYLMAQIKTPCSSPLAPDAFLANWQAALSDLAEAAQPLSQLMATDALQQCFGPEYVECWRAFVREFPQVVDRTVERLCQAIIKFARGDLPILNAHVLMRANEVIELEEQLKGLKKDMQAMEAMEAKQAQAAERTSLESSNNTTLKIINPKFLPTPKPKYNAAKTVSRSQPTKDKDTRAKSALKKKLFKTAQRSANSMVSPVLANADSGATGTYLRIQDIQVVRDVKVSLPAEQITVAVAEGTLIRSTHHGYLDIPGHGAMIAHIFPQLHGSLLSISQLVNLGLHVSYCANFVTFFDREVV